MLLEGRGSVACLVSSVNPEENGKKKNTVLSWKSGRVAMGLHILKQRNENQKSKGVFFTVSGKQNCLL